jgi:hypothetical protein
VEDLMVIRTYHISNDCYFNRTQLLDRDYDPMVEGVVNRDYLESQYAGHVNLDHAAAVRAILVREGKSDWRWIWGIGLLHDEITVRSGYPKLYARYRNQNRMLPRIIFERGADVHAALELLLEETPLERDDLINIETEGAGRWMSIGDCLGL